MVENRPAPVTRNAAPGNRLFAPKVSAGFVDADGEIVAIDAEDARVVPSVIEGSEFATSTHGCAST